MSNEQSKNVIGYGLLTVGHVLGVIVYAMTIFVAFQLHGGGGALLAVFAPVIATLIIAFEIIGAIGFAAFATAPFGAAVIASVCCYVIGGALAAAEPQ